MKQKILHHGLCSEEFEPRFIGTDYFAFYHKPCVGEKLGEGYCKITKVLIDEHMRIIFNLECLTCGKKDALKTIPWLWRSKEAKKTEKKTVDEILKIFEFSPIYKNCVGRHSWDR